MEHQDTLYPYELLSLLEALHEQVFGGRVTLHADDGRTLLYLVDGQVRYATTTGVAGSFPAYLIVEEVFPRERVRLWLEECTDEEQSLEAMMLGRHKVDPDGLVHLKGDLARMVFARAFGATSMVEVESFRGAVPNFGATVLDPYQAMFRSVAESPVHGPMLDHFQGLWKRPIRRGPAFFVLLPVFRRYFGRTPLPAMVDTSPLLADLAAETTDVETVVAQLFAMCLSGMTYFQGDRVRSHLARGRAIVEEAAAAEAAAGRAQPPDRPTNQLFASRGPAPPSSAPTFDLDGISELPELPEISQVRRIPAPEVRGDGPTQVAKTSAPISRRLRTAAGPAPPPPRHPVYAESEAIDFADLRGSLVGEGLVSAAELARDHDEYELFGVPARAPLSEVRSAYQRARKRYDDENFDGYYLPPSADNALRYLQQRIETGYEALTDLRRRWEHDTQRAVEGGLGRDEMEQMFYAEGVFKAAQIRMAKGLNAAAMELLEEALEHYTQEPEYIAYLAWAHYSAALAGQPLPIGASSPEYLLDKALQMSPKLESAWLFRARIADHAEDGPAALAAYYSVLTANPDNDEAKAMIEAYKNAGVVTTAEARPSLADRLAQILRRR